MALSLFVNESIIDIPHVVNKYWFRKFDDDHILITAEHGAWVSLNKQEFDLLRSDNITQDLNLFGILEEKGIITTERNIERLTQMYRDRFHYLFNGVSLHIITTTLRCNHRCVYCYASSKPLTAKGFDMDRDTAKAVVDFIFQTPSKHITIEFQGGEPLVNFPIIEYMFEYAKKKNKTSTCTRNGIWIGKKNIEFQMVSNFSLMDDDILNFIIKNKIRICTSLDGPKEVHDKNRHYSNGSSYEKVVYWIEKIIKEKKYEYFKNAISTLTKFSLPFYKEIVDEYVKHGFKNIKARPANIAGVAMSMWKKIGFSSEEYVDFWKKYFKYILSLNKRGIKLRDVDTTFMLRRIIPLIPPSNACLGAPCGACLIQAGYNQWGDVYTCDEARSNEIFKLDNVKESNYKEIYTTPNALNFIGLTSMVSSGCDNCVWHPYCSPCLVSTYGEQKNLISKLPSDFFCKIRGKQTEYIFEKLLLSEEDRKILIGWLSER